MELILRRAPGIRRVTVEILTVGVDLGLLPGWNGGSVDPHSTRL